MTKGIRKREMDAVATSAEWSGRMGLEWARQASFLDRMMDVVGLPGIEALGPIDGLSVLDVGCGAGSTSRALAARGAVVTGVDISEDLLKVAQERNPGITFVAQDASTFEAQDPFDKLFSRLGMMFFDDPPQALSHLRAQLKPEARAVMVCWRAMAENPWAHVPVTLVEEVVGPPETLSGPGPGPFAWAGAQSTKALLEAAGWQEVSFTARDHILEFFMGDAPDPLDRAVAFFSRVGTVARRLKDMDDPTRARAKAHLHEGLHPFVQGDCVQLPGATWVIEARAH
ncbi:MAG: class I SAM-dependent methyltransferase [Pseudomonadota bacterium]